MKSAALIFLLFLAKFGLSQHKELPIKVLEATSQHWVSGAPGGKTGTKYSIKIYIRTDKKIEFVNLWLGNKNVPFDVEFYSIEIQKKIQQGDSILITCNEIRGDAEEMHAMRVPFKYKGAALIEATVDGKTRYFIISKIKTLPALQGM
jgi:hypothetical protein